MYKIQRIKLENLQPNTGQIDGLPINPRQWTKGDVIRIAQSLAFQKRIGVGRVINGAKAIEKLLADKEVQK